MDFVLLHHCILYIWLTQLDLTFAAKVRKRFELERLYNRQFHVILPENSLISMNPKYCAENRAGQKVYKTFMSILDIFNASDTFVPESVSGVPDKYGNYSGLVGMVQRNEADGAFFIVRPDALPFEPVRIGPVLGSDEMVLLATRQSPKLNKLDISRLFLNFDQLTYCYLVFCTYFIMVVSLAIDNLHCNSGRKVFDLRRILKHIYNYCWSILELLVDQENCKPIEWSKRLQWLFYCIASFVLVFGFFTNLMSTELVAYIKPPELHSLADLFTPYFEQMNAFILTNLPSYGLVKLAKPSKPLGLLYQRLSRDLSSSLVNVNFEDLQGLMAKMFIALEGIQNGQLCMATTDYAITLMRLGSCVIQPKIWSNMYYTSTFGQGLVTSFYHKELPAHVLKFIEYKARTFHEMAIVGQLIQNALELNLAEKSPQPFNWKAFQCFHGMTDTGDGTETAANIQLTINAAGNVFVYGFYAVILAMLVLLIDILFRPKSTVKKTIKKKRQSRRRKIYPHLINTMLTLH